MYVFHELRDRLRRWLGEGRLKNAKVRRVLLGGLFFAVLTLILANQVTPQRLDVQVDQLAPRNVYATRDVENRVATERLRKAAADAIPPMQTVDASVLKEAEDFIDYAFSEIVNVRTLQNQDQKTRVETLAAKLNLGAAVSPETLSSLLAADDKLLSAAKDDAVRLTTITLSGRVAKEDVADLRAKIDQEENGFTLSISEPWLKGFVKEVVKVRIRSNLVDDPIATNQLRAAASAAVEPVVWKEGQLIIKEREPVTVEQYTMLEDLGMVGTRADIRYVVGTGMLSLVIIALIVLYLARHRKDLLERESKLLLLGMIGISTYLLAILMKAFQPSLPTGANVGFLMPVAVSAMLISILMDPKVAMLQSALISLLVGLSAQGNQLSTTLVLMIGATLSVYMVARVESRTDVYKAGSLVSLAHVVTILAIYLINGNSLLEAAPWVDAGLGALNGLVVAVIVTGALPLFETVFGVITPLKLLELSNPNHPLLKKLLVEAPGSYHHTILVANLCEAAAEAIGADQVLARVGAYYHDIGKTKRPYFFVENQFGGENPHDKLPPSLSALIITSHVKDGVEMATEARLPKEIVDFIPTHHGTTLVSYFYHMASKSGQAEYVLEEDFRYEGPKPWTKEHAILMLADGCEASVRALRQKGHLTVDQIEAQVKRIIDDRLHQGQLDNCDLTLREIDVITRTFVKVLSGVHHARVEYPEAVQAKLPAPTEQAAPAEPAPTQEVKDDGNLGQQ